MFPYIPSPEQGQEVPVYRMDEVSPPSSYLPPSPAPTSADHCPEKVLQPRGQMDVGFIS